ncbi:MULTISPECIES: hypothetical protein [unclassified Gilliamella]|uniref:hypothetical protein n=1 Tax=unclassified Gilliamella TaxID=2685620 RepID=UPI001305B0F7|nr:MULTISPECIES: hypothetical protein [unclassified Gilliamella]MWP48559.1 hypothetical protein [Gilliamella sp. Lep-s35]MWP68621.1 hypothetical protein [Gilliamella sp. Lep-s5]MWP76711.1 hypothetical protein [Gilliamella sp. Lep-s21]
MRYLIYFLRRAVIDHLYKFNQHWDKKLNEIIDDFEIVEFDRYQVTLRHNSDDYQIRIANYPYSSHVLEFKNEVRIKERFRPSIRTQYRFDNLVLKPILKELTNQEQQRFKNICG